MAQMTIYKKESTKNPCFFRDNILIGTAKYTSGFSMDEIMIYQNDQPKYRFKETMDSTHKEHFRNMVGNRMMQ